MKKNILHRSLMNAPIDINNYLTIEFIENGVFRFNPRMKYDVFYCINGDGNWSIIGTSTLSINAKQTVSFKCNVSASNTIISEIGQFYISGLCRLKGNCMSMLYGDDAINQFSLVEWEGYIFDSLFKNCGGIVHVSKNFLPATTLGFGCYTNMFEGCSLLCNTPDLPAAALDYRCYYRMFYGCSRLCYIKTLVTDRSESSGMSNWVYNVNSRGFFIKDSTMTSLPTGASGIPSNWTVVDNDITINHICTGNGCVAEEGMTWGDWLNSVYNIYGYIVKDGMLYESNSSSRRLFYEDGITIVQPSDYIIEGHYYRNVL